MNQTDEVLLVLLSIVLIILLALLIWIAVYAIKIMRGIKRMVDDANKIVDSAETVSEALKSSGGTASFVKIITNLGHVVSKQRNRGKDE